MRSKQPQAGDRGKPWKVWLAIAFLAVTCFAWLTILAVARPGSKGRHEGEKFVDAGHNHLALPPLTESPREQEAGGMASMGSAMGAGDDPDEEPEPMSASTAPLGNDPPIDDLVQKESTKWETEGKGGVLSPIPVTATGPREPAAVATEIDRAINARLKTAGLTPAPRADDAEFLRRAYLDIVGCIPPLAKTKSFLADTSPGKRAKLIDDLLADHEAGVNFAHYWQELLVKRDPDNNKAIQTREVFVKWMTGQFNQNHPWDHTVKSMLTAQGDQALAGETFFVLANAENGQPAANKMVGTAAALFLGNQLMCAECHVHPNVPQWTQQDFWGLAAFFGKTRATRAGAAKNPNDAVARISDVAAAPKAKGKKAVVGTLPDGSIPIPDPRNDGKTIGSAKAKLFGVSATTPSTSVNRPYAADWFVSASNPYFPRAAANRVWSLYFARGLINPLDDIRPDSRATHAEVLHLLAEELIVSKFDLKHLMRCICATEAYQRSSRPGAGNAADEELYSHMPVKVIPPRALLASLAVATDNRFQAPKDDVLDKRGNGEQGLAFFDAREYDESAAEYSYGVPHFLRLMNTQLPPACDAAAKSMGTGPRAQVIEQLYLRTLARRPTAQEAAKMTAFVGRQTDPVKGYSAALWVLLTSAEFVCNH
ncbi:DUF1549 domain-containing protein [Fimbriiglobus ruber]|nr:DUF1549 domain-containing protein [Fimbriiglobus ruber]